MAQTEDQIRQQYQEAVSEARNAYTNASEQLSYALSQLDAAPEETDPTALSSPLTQKRKELQARVDTLQKTYNDAQQSYTTVLTQRASASTKAADDSDPATKARLQAQADADTARATQIKAEVNEYLATAPDRRAVATQDARLKKAQADEAEYSLALARETDPQKREAAQAALERARADTARVQAETAQIGRPAPRTPEQQRTDTATATTAEATAGVAGGLAESTLKKAQADADTAAQNLVNAQRAARQAPTDAQAQAAITTAQKALDLANQNLEQQIAQAGNLNPIAVQQAQATLDRSKQTIQQTQLGDLYGRPQQLQQIRDLVAAGEITPQQADGMSAALNSGTTVYQALQQAQSDRATARTQDVSNKNALAGNFTSAFTSGFSQLADMNKYAPPGSTAGADAFVGLLNMAQDRLKGYEVAPAQQTDYLSQTPSTSVGQMANLAQQQTAPPVAAAPAPVEQGHTININIGGSGAASNPQPPTTAPLPAGVAGTPNDPRNMAVSGYQGAPNPNAFGSGVGQMADMAAAKVPAGVNDIYQAYGLDPSKRRSGMQVA
jgi:hypothetical protein